jgi:hypothetical protein
LKRCKDAWPTLTKKVEVADCLKKLFWSLEHVHDKERGIPALKLHSMDPLNIARIEIGASDAFSGELTNVVFTGVMGVLNERNLDVV